MSDPTDIPGRTTNGLVGHYFLSEPNPRRRTHAWQGRIVAAPAADVYLVELNSWLDGWPTERKLVRLDEMRSWTFFNDAKRWRERGDEIQALTWQNASTAGPDGD